MTNDRKLVRWLVIGIPAVLILLAMTTNFFTPTGTIYGRVTYNGKPLERGFILFYPADEKCPDWVVGTIDHGGTYRIDSKWRHNSSETRFRICIIPRKMRPSAHQDMRDDGSESRVVPVSLGANHSEPHRPVAVEVGFPKRFTNVLTSGLQITLGREPARIDIDMKD